MTIHVGVPSSVKILPVCMCVDEWMHESHLHYQGYYCGSQANHKVIFYADTVTLQKCLDTIVQLYNLINKTKFHMTKGILN